VQLFHTRRRSSAICAFALSAICFEFGCAQSEPAPATILPDPPNVTSETSSSSSTTSALSESGAVSAPASVSVRASLQLEKTDLKFGFIKLTDCAPLVIAREKGFFQDEGLQVEVIAQPNWKTLLDNVINGELDGAHMLSGQPIAATIGIGTKSPIVTAYTMDLNGNGITVSNSIWEQMQSNDEGLRSPTPPHPISAAALKPIVDQMLAEGRKLQMAMVFPVSTH
jgi:nitrate/nitrite transport system substrate-binding protein